ncbi:MAG: DUF58 domain-containing protein [Chloroflexi bacterium]|jgi:uncharacterized protein (DUF58 family)|nr:DUF58 domain-containing protein [Chloroflexota bacterium]
MIRRIPYLVVGTILVVAALSTGLPFLFYLVYLGVFVGVGSYLVTRQGLTDLEAGFAVAQVHGHVGDQLRATVTVRNAGRFPKLWLETFNPSNLPVPLPGRALSLGPRSQRTWNTKVPLTRRGHFRVDALQVRTGDPFGFFESVASVGHGVSVVVYPRIERLPHWRLPTANLEGSHASRERALQTTPLATSVRPYAPGDSFNRIHWKSTARHGEIQVKEFDLEQTADVWIFLDLDAGVQTGSGDRSTVEVAVRAAASIADKALGENRAVAITTNGHHPATLPPDRGPRQRHKIMQLLAAVEGDGSAPLAEALVVTLPRLRRGTTAVVITGSDEPEWVRPLATLRPRGLGCAVVLLDAPTFSVPPAPRTGEPAPEPDPEAAQAMRATRHRLAEFDLRTITVRADERLGEVLA